VLVWSDIDVDGRIEDHAGNLLVLVTSGVIVGYGTILGCGISAAPVNLE
jgi:hypothetical protein